MPIIKMPDGQNADFPNDMPLDQIKSVIQKKYGFNKKESSPLQMAGDWAEKNINQPIQKNIVDPSISALAGFEQGIANVAPGLANLGISGINALGGNVSKVPMFDFAPKNTSSEAGNLASFFLGPGILNSFSKIPGIANTIGQVSNIPRVGAALDKASDFFENYPSISNIGKNAILGGAYSPDDPLKGISLGATAGIVGEGISKGISGIKEYPISQKIKNMYSKIDPYSHADKLTNFLSGGSNNITENSKSLADDIRNAYNMRNEQSNIFFKHAFDQAGNEKIYDSVSPLVSTAVDKSKNTLNKIKNLNIGDLYDSFKSNPTFENAHNLQSELGSMIGDMKNNPHRTPDETNQLNLVTSVRNQLKNDISDFTKRYDEKSNIPIGGAYQKGIDLYRDNVSPYLSDNKLRNIVRLGKTNVKNIHSIFDTPTNTINKKGEEEIGPINKIMKDLPENSKNKILFSAIGGEKKSPNSLLDSLIKAKNKGYSSYFTPEIDNSLNSLNEKIKNREFYKNMAKVAGTGAVAGIAGGIMGNSLAHFI